MDDLEFEPLEITPLEEIDFEGLFEEIEINPEEVEIIFEDIDLNKLDSILEDFNPDEINDIIGEIDFEELDSILNGLEGVAEFLEEMN